MYLKLLIFLPAILIPACASFSPAFLMMYSAHKGFPGSSDGKKICLQCNRLGLNPWVRKIPWRWKWQPTPIFLPEEFHGQGSLVGYSPWGCQESDKTERVTLSSPVCCLEDEPAAPPPSFRASVCFLLLAVLTCRRDQLLRKRSF